MTRINTRVTRRTFLWTATKAAAALALSACRTNYSKAGSIAARDVLRDLRQDPVINRLRTGKISFMHKSREAMSPKGKDTFSIIQRGLFALELIDDSPSRFQFGIYGPKTERAVKHLQIWAEIGPEVGSDGTKFEMKTLSALEAALELKINNHWIPPRNI